MRLKLSSDVLALNPYAGATLTVARDTAARKRSRVPRASSNSPTGLTALVAERGWSVQAHDGYYRLYKINQPAMDTGRCADEAEACRCAKALESPHDC